MHFRGQLVCMHGRDTGAEMAAPAAIALILTTAPLLSAVLG